MSARRRQSAEEMREMFEERQAVQQHGREHGQYYDLSTPSKRRAAAELAAAERNHQPRRLETPSQP